jgi:hypothetical protein
MDPSNYQSFEDLFDEIENSSIKKIRGQELACISKLAFYNGTKLKEIPELQVRDVVNQVGNVLKSIKKFKKEIILTDESISAIQKHIVDMQKKNPRLVMRRAPLFPSYKSEKTIREHLKEFDTKYSEIKSAGINCYVANNKMSFKRSGEFYKAGANKLRTTERQFRARANKKNIPSGQDVIDNRCADKIMSLYEEAENLIKNDKPSKQRAKEILKESQKTANKIQNKEKRNNYGSLIPLIRSLLSPYINN